MEQTGGKWMSLIGAYMIVKGIVNLILGFSVGNIVTLLISGVLAFLIIKGVPYMNYVTGAYLAVDERDTYHPEYSGTSLVLSGRGYY